MQMWQLSAVDAAWHRSCLLSDRVTDHLPHLSSSTLTLPPGRLSIITAHHTASLAEIILPRLQWNNIRSFFTYTCYKSYIACIFPSFCFHVTGCWDRWVSRERQHLWDSSSTTHQVLQQEGQSDGSCHAATRMINVFIYKYISVHFHLKRFFVNILFLRNVCHAPHYACIRAMCSRQLFVLLSINISLILVPRPLQMLKRHWIDKTERTFRFTLHVPSGSSLPLLLLSLHLPIIPKGTRWLQTEMPSIPLDAPLVLT